MNNLAPNLDTYDNTHGHVNLDIHDLIDFVRPYVELGYDAYQIGNELAKQSIYNISDSQVQLAINQIMGDAE